MMRKIILSILFIWISSIVFSQITISVNQQNVTCFGLADGGATVTATGGTPAYSYTWLPGGQTTSNATNLTSGQYTVIVADASLATNSYTFNITEPTQLTVNTQVFLNCYNPCSNEAFALVTGGTAPYTYAWSNGAVTQQTVGTLCTGNYSVQITDANGCVDTSLFNLNYNSITVAETHTNSTCSGLCNGAISFSVTGGSGYYNYIFFTEGSPGWPGITITSLNQNSLCAGSYSFVATDSVTGCASSITLLLQNNTSSTIPNASITSTSYNESCLAFGNGSIDVAVSGSNIGPFTYLWSNGSTTQDAINLTSNPYWVTISDASSNCTTLYDTIFSVNNIPNAIITTTNYNETCFNSGDGSINLNITGSNSGPFTYLWSNGSTTQDILNINSNIYSVRVTDANSNCILLVDTINSIGINCGSISGNVYIDNNSDCILNSGDNNSTYSSIIVQPGNRYGYVNSAGDYIINDLPFGTYSVSVNSHYIFNIPTCTTTLVTSVNSTTPNAVNNNMSVGFNSGTQPDMNVAAYSNGIVPGFVCHVNYYLYNMNNVSASGLYKVTLPSAFISNIVSGTPSNYIIAGDTVIWNFSNIIFNGNMFYSPPLFSIDFIPPLSTPLGSTFTTCIFAQPSITDFDYTNNTYCYQRMVTGSFDPNDKSVSPVGVGANGDISANETELTYLIRFQNTGNGPAVNIVVRDTLSTNVDASTFEMLGSSHSYKVDILQGNVLRWKFNNIMLPDSNSNEPASHGYILYRIKRTANNTPGTQIKNTAYIYFDFNEPVVTNTTLNTIETLTGIQSHGSSQNSFDVYPNPSSSAISIKITDGSITSKTYNIKITDVLGKEILTTNYKEEINISNLEKGIYFLSVYQNNQLIGTKKVVKE